MHARSNALVGDPQRMDEGIAYLRDEVLPVLLGIDGCVGLSLLCDRDEGRCIATTAWETEEAMRAGDPLVRGNRARAAELFAAAAPEVREWEIAVVHRAQACHDGAWARVVWGESDPARLDDDLTTFRLVMIPRMEQLPGFCSLSVFVDRATGRSALTSCYHSGEHMDRARDVARNMREELGKAMGVRVTDMAEFELVLHHLRVPETV